jgi:integrase
MNPARPRAADATKILTRREIAAVLADLKRKAPRSPGTRLNLVLFRLACCCGLRASEIAALQIDDVRVGVARPHLRIPPPPASRHQREFGPRMGELGPNPLPFRRPAR